MEYIKNFTFQDSITSPATGEILYSGKHDNVTVFITGTSTSRTIAFQACDEDGNWYSCQAIRLSDSIKATSTTGTAEAWVIDTTLWSGVRTNVIAVAGGTVKIVGKVFESGGHTFDVSTTTSLSGSLAKNHTDVSVTADTDIITDYTATANCNSTLMVMTDTGGVLSLEVDAKMGELNGGVALTVNQWYAFDIPLLSGSVYNLQLSANATMQIKWIGGI